MRTLASLLIGVALSASACADLYSRAYGPRGQLMLRQPEMQWQLWADGGHSISSVWARLNGKDVPVRYDKGQSLVVVRFDRALPPGTYRMEMGAESSDGLAVQKKWEFSIRPDALPDLPSTTDDQREALAALNQFRRAIGTPDVHPHPGMAAAAQLHAQYLALNKTTGHYENPGQPGFIGATPEERLAAFNYIDNHYEVVHFGPTQPLGAIMNLVAAPYHRVPFLHPGSVPAGAGSKDNRLVLLFGMNHESKTMVYPIPNQGNVPTLWDQTERPNPLRIHPGLKQPVGYPVMLTHFSPEPCEIRLESASLAEVVSGAPVDIAVNHPGNDGELSTTVFFMPRTPLKPGTGYRAAIRAKLSSGQDVSRTWVFHTAP